MKDRIRKIRKENKLTQKEFAEKLGIKQNTVASYEMGRIGVSDSVIISICREFGVNEDWLRNGNGDMCIPAEDEDAAIVSDLLEESNSLYGIIKGIMKTYKKLDIDSQKVIENFAEELLDELKKGG